MENNNIMYEGIFWACDALLGSGGGDGGRVGVEDTEQQDFSLIFLYF